MITLSLLSKHPEAISQLVKIWHAGLGAVWKPDMTVVQIENMFHQHLQDGELPLIIIALDGQQPIGMCSLRATDKERPKLTPRLGALVVEPAYQRRGIGKMLIEACKDKAREFGYSKA